MQGRINTVIQMPFGKGTYALVLYVAKSVTIEVGRLGQLAFQNGHYLYIGSAFGPGGLQARLKHHLKISQNPHWHIDYLRKAGAVVEIWWSINEESQEDQWVGFLESSHQFNCPHKGFGSSDSRSYSHLFFSKSRPSINVLEKRTRGLSIPLFRKIVD